MTNPTIRPNDELHAYLTRYADALIRHVAQARKGERDYGQRAHTVSRAGIRDQMNLLDGRLKMAFYAGIVPMGSDIETYVTDAIRNAEAYLRESAPNRRRD